MKIDEITKGIMTLKSLGFTQKEIAELLELNPNTVSQRISKLRIFVKSAMNKEKCEHGIFNVLSETKEKRLCECRFCDEIFTLIRQK